MSIPITDLLPEIQLRVNSDPDRYNPNRNNYIDDGEEISTLLSEYKLQSVNGLKSSFWGVDRKTVEERTQMKELKGNYYSNSATKKIFQVAEWGLGVFGGLALCCGVFPVAAICGGIALVSHLIHDEIAEDDAYDAIKAEQAKKANEIRANNKKREEEMRKQEEAMRVREEALKAKELEYQERMNTATSNIEKNVSSAQRKARQLNKDLKEAQQNLTIPKDTTSAK